MLEYWHTKDFIIFVCFLQRFYNELSLCFEGTPVQNDLQEFYAIIEFVNPGILGSSTAYKKVYEEPILRSRQPSCTEVMLLLSCPICCHIQYIKTAELILASTNRRRDFWEKSEPRSSLAWPACSSWGGHRRLSTTTCHRVSTGRCSATLPLCSLRFTGICSATESSGRAFRAPHKLTHTWPASLHWRSSVTTLACSTPLSRLQES